MGALYTSRRRYFDNVRRQLDKGMLRRGPLRVYGISGPKGPPGLCHYYQTFGGSDFLLKGPGKEMGIPEVKMYQRVYDYYVWIFPRWFLVAQDFLFAGLPHVEAVSWYERVSMSIYSMKDSFDWDRAHNELCRRALDIFRKRYIKSRLTDEALESWQGYYDSFLAGGQVIVRPQRLPSGWQFFWPMSSGDLVQMMGDFCGIVLMSSDYASGCNEEEVSLGVFREMAELFRKVVSRRNPYKQG